MSGRIPEYVLTKKGTPMNDYHPTYEPTTTDPATINQLWKDPDWTCPRCRAANKAIRGCCRICNFDSELVSGGKELR